MKKIFITIVIIFLSLSAYCSDEFDSSIDSDIRKQYNVKELPALPKVEPSSTSLEKKIKIPKELSSFHPTGKVCTLKNRTKLTLVSKEKISNWNSIGKKVTFISQTPIITREGITIPSGTVFKGTITNSHAPQITGNGGLIELQINEIHYNGITSVISTKIQHVNSKKIYHNDIKGRRKYWQNCAKSMTPGKKTFKAMNKGAKSLFPYPIINILSIVPLTIGVAVYLVNIPIAPVSSLFMKGESITLESGSIFEVITTGNNQINY